MADFVHIVCLDAPSPPDYGGAIDMFYKIRSLAETGKKIILHYFQYHPGRGHQGLEKFCSAIYTYPRRSFYRSPLQLPFIVGSRVNQEMIQRLNQDDHPVVLEGLHCSGLLPYLKKERKILLRLHNNEALYYRHLARTESRWLKRLYFRREARLLDRFQRKVPKETRVACLSAKDLTDMQEQYGWKNCFFLPSFLPWQRVEAATGKGTFCFYHGNLSVAENEAAVLWLIENVFHQGSIPLVVAGKGISKKLRSAADHQPHISLYPDPSIAELDRLVREAQIHVLPSMNATGVKLKLLHALLEGRFCIANGSAVNGSGMEGMVTLAETASEWSAAITTLMKKEFTPDLRDERRKILSLYDNKVNAERINAQW